MRLRLFERLGRLTGWRGGSRAQGRRRTPGKGARDDGGRHRKSAGTSREPGAGPQEYRRSGPVRPQPNGGAGRAPGPQPNGVSSRTLPAPGGGGIRPAAGGGGAGRARIREAPYGAAPVETASAGQEFAQASQQAVAVPRQPWYQVVGEPAGLAGRPAAGLAGQPAGGGGGVESVARRGVRGARRGGLPFAPPHSQGLPPSADGRRNCGALEAILWRQWDAATMPPHEVVEAVDRLAELPRQLQEKLAARLDGIYVGAGGVPDLDDMAALHGVPLPSGRATWDACAGAYGELKIVVGSRPSPTPDVVCHEVGHALDDIDSPPGKWQSDSAEFRMIYDQCQPFIATDFHRQRGGLGRKEFFADAFAAIASAQRPALVDMLSGNTRIALRVMLYFNRRYGI